MTGATKLVAKTLSSFDYTHVLYDASSTTSRVLAFLTLFPVLLNASYAALIIVTRELTIINMLIGQLLNEQFNNLIKNIVREERLLQTHGKGYAFPSSHSQWIGYFSTFLIIHIWTRHSFASHENAIADTIQNTVITAFLVVFACLVAYSRYYLSYHTPIQVVAGLVVGIFFGAAYYFLTELTPENQPESAVGKLRKSILDSHVAQWARIKDGWSVYPDGGHEEEWARWREARDLKQRTIRLASPKSSQRKKR